MGLFAFRPLSEKQKKDNPLRPLRLCGELLRTAKPGLGQGLESDED